MKVEKIVFNLWTFLAVFIALACTQTFSVKEVYAKGDIILQAEISNPAIQKCEDSYRIILPTKFRLINKTNKKLLLIKDAVDIVGFETAKSKSDFEKEIYLSQRFTLPGSVQKNLLNLQSPTEDRTEIIPQNGRYEWDSDNWYNFSKTRDDRSYSLPGLSLEKLQSLDSLWIKYQVAFFPMNAMETEGNNLKKNWETFGDLVLDTISTQPIKISVPKKLSGLCD